MAASKLKFDSEGFDLDAISSPGKSNDAGVVYEIGGGATTEPSKTCQSNDNDKDGNKSKEPSPIDESERLKELGNNEFRRGNHLDAYDYYTEAIEACPNGEGVGPTGPELLKLRDEFENEQRQKMYERHRKETEKRRLNGYDASGKEKGDGNAQDEDEEDDQKGPVSFTPPPHLYGPKLAVYYANRAATLLHLGRNGEALDDCDISLILNPTYVKALLRRCTAHERMEDTESALKDANKALQLEPANAVARKNVTRLKKLEDERLEKLKGETMDKLKDLGNSILGNFGLSLDNFNAVQDPKTGGYSISFNQNPQQK